MSGIEVTEMQTQDGYDWPNLCAHEQWPAEAPAEQDTATDRE